LLQEKQQAQQPTYTKAQLQAYLSDPTSSLSPEQRIWALNEIDQIDKTERQREMRELFEANQKKTIAEQTRNQAFQNVINQFPQIAYRDNNGGFLGFNTSDPMFQKMSQYMSDPDLSKHPRGLEVAAKMAAFDLGVTVAQNLQRKVNQTTAQLRKEQKKQLIAGGGTPAQVEGSSAKIKKLTDEYAKTGNKEAFKQLAKMKGLIPEL